MIKLSTSGVQIIYLWSIGIIFSVYLPLIGSTPVIVRQGRTSISLGPCTWIIDRKCPDTDINFYLFTRRNPQDRQLVQIGETWETSNLSTSYFNVYDPVKIIIHGYNSDMFLHPLIQMKNEYLQRGDYNLFYVDWSILAPGPCYVSAVHNARHTGECIGQLIQRIIDAGTANIHLIGFSLGAQVTNFVARNVNPFLIPRITGLDPAMPLFITANIDEKLDPTDAVFVDVIHTNAFVQGKIERCGHVDFYMNGGILQPGCFDQNENPFACSHHRAPDYFKESIRSYKGFWGWECGSYINYLLGMCPATDRLALAGEDCDSDTTGMYLITTNNNPPFALGKWNEINSQPPENGPVISAPFTRKNPLAQQSDNYGKLEGTFNNIIHIPTPYSQDPNGENWPYFGYLGTKEITQFYDEYNNRQNDVNVHVITLSPFDKNKKLSGNTFNPLKKLIRPTRLPLRNRTKNAFLNKQITQNNIHFGFSGQNVFDLPILNEH